MPLLPTAVCAAFALFLTSASALAQDTTQQPPQQSQTQAPSAPGTGGVTGNLGPAGPRFQVHLKNFEVFDETSWDFWWSDEAVFFVIAANYKLNTREFGSLDSDGTVHSFDQNASCAFPATDSGLPDGRWSCEPAGAAAPISFLLQAYEQDFSIGFCAPNEAQSDVYPPGWAECGEDLGKHQIIGEAYVTLDLSALMSRLPNVGDSFDRNVFLEGGCFRQGAGSLCKADDIEPRYNVNYTVTRVTDSTGNSGGVVVDQ